MNTSTRTSRRTFGAVAATILVAVSAAAAAGAANERPAGMTPQEYKALMIRSQALNTLYGKQVTGPSPAELRALRIRGEALNAIYGNRVARALPPRARGSSGTMQESVPGRWPG